MSSRITDVERVNMSVLNEPYPRLTLIIVEVVELFWTPQSGSGPSTIDMFLNFSLILFTNAAGKSWVEPC